MFDPRFRKSAWNEKIFAFLRPRGFALNYKNENHRLRKTDLNDVPQSGSVVS
jgi:hypothetical protein